MNRPSFWNVVPQPVRIAACAIICCAVLIGVAVGITQGNAQACRDAGALCGLLGMGVGLLAGSFVAIWVLCLGYVYADARQRAMPPVLWTLVAALIPNLLGFLLYFALRKPLSSLCVQCGRPGDAGRFCSTCGFDKLASPAGSAGPNPSN